MMKRPEIPDLFIEMIAAGELDDARRNEIEAEFGAEEIERRVAELRRSNAEILDRHPAPEMAASILARANPARATRTRRREPRSATGRLTDIARGFIMRGSAVKLTAAVAGAGLVLILGVYLITMAEHLGAGNPGVRAKGIHPTLLVYRQAGSGVELLQEGDMVKARDTLQLSYVAAGEKYGVILSVDGRGVVTVHLPDSSARAAELGQSGQVPLEYAYQLDDAPRFERFFFITSERPFSVDEVVRDARKIAGTGAAETGRLPLQAGLEQSSLLLKKAGG